MARKGITRRVKWGAAAGQLIGRGLRYGAKRYLKSKMSTISSGKSREMAPLTGEKDVRVTYVKRRMARRRKRNYLRRVKSFRSMVMKDEPCRISTFTDVREIGIAENTSRYFGAFMGLYSQSFYGNNLGEVWNQITNGAASDLKAKTGTLRVDHMGLNVLIRNNSSAGEPPLDIDVYKVVCIRDMSNALWNAGLPIEDVHAELKSQMRQHKGMDIEVDESGVGIAVAQENAGNAYNNQVVGDVLFNNPPFLRYFRVIKCWKVHLPVGSTAHFQWRDSRNYNCDYNQCFSNLTGTLAAKKGITKGYIFNCNGRYATAAETGGSAKYLGGSIVEEIYTRYNCKTRHSTADTLVYTA